MPYSGWFSTLEQVTDGISRQGLLQEALKVNMFPVIGSLVELAQNIHSDTSGTVGDSTYIAFLVLTLLGVVLAAFICNADKIIRNDGSKVILMKHPTWKSEIVGLWEVLKSDFYIVTMFPMFLASNWFYTYQFNVSGNQVSNKVAGKLDHFIRSPGMLTALLSVGFQPCPFQRAYKGIEYTALLVVTDYWCLCMGTTTRHHIGISQDSSPCWPNSPFRNHYGPVGRWLCLPKNIRSQFRQP